MSLARLTAILIKMDERLQNLERTAKATEKRVRDIAGAVGSPTGELAFKAMMRPSTDELKQAFQNKSVMHLECIEMEATFSHALYMGISPESRDKIRELLAPAQLNYLKNVLENHKKLNELAGWADNFMKNATKNLEKQKDKIRIQVEQAIMVGNNSVVKRYREMEKQLQLPKNRSGTALENVAKAQASTAAVLDIINQQARPEKKVFSIGAKK